MKNIYEMDDSMKSFFSKNINLLFSLFLIATPLIDLLTGLCIHHFDFQLTIGMIVRMFFIISMMIITPIYFNKKKLYIFYLLITLYAIFYIIGIIQYKGPIGLFREIQGLLRTFYFPILFCTMYSIKDEIRISTTTFLIILISYLVLIFFPTLFGIGYETYEITKKGTLGFFNSANEISGIISILTPILFIHFLNSKVTFLKALILAIYIAVILNIGTKTPLLSLGITFLFTFFYFFIHKVRKKDYKCILLFLSCLVVIIFGLSVIIPKSNFYKNIKTHMRFLKVDNINEIFAEQDLVDHFIFSQRLTFLREKRLLYNNSNI